MSDWDDWDEDTTGPPSRLWVAVVAVVLLVPFLWAFAGLSTMLEAGWFAVLGVVGVLVAIALGYWIVTRWLLRPPDR